MCQKDSKQGMDTVQKNLPLLPTEEELSSLTTEQREMYLHLFSEESNDSNLSLIARFEKMDEEKRKERMKAQR